MLAPMLAKPCPVCGRFTAKDLKATNKIAHVNYSCEGCHHIWTTDRKTGEFLRHITPPPEPLAPKAK